MVWKESIAEGLIAYSINNRLLSTFHQNFASVQPKTVQFSLSDRPFFPLHRKQLKEVISSIPQESIKTQINQLSMSLIYYRPPNTLSFYY